VCYPVTETLARTVKCKAHPAFVNFWIFALERSPRVCNGRPGSEARLSPSCAPAPCAPAPCAGSAAALRPYPAEPPPRHFSTQQTHKAAPRADLSPAQRDSAWRWGQARVSEPPLRRREAPRGARRAGVPGGSEPPPHRIAWTSINPPQPAFPSKPHSEALPEESPSAPPAARPCSARTTRTNWPRSAQLQHSLNYDCKLHVLAHSAHVWYLYFKSTHHKTGQRSRC